MAPIHAVSGTIRHFPDFPAQGRVDVMRDGAVKLFHFTSIAIVFAFVLILTTGAHP
jgi:hypothetical protein